MVRQQIEKDLGRLAQVIVTIGAIGQVRPGSQTVRKKALHELAMWQNFAPARIKQHFPLGQNGFPSVAKQKIFGLAPLRNSIFLRG